MIKYILVRSKQTRIFSSRYWYRSLTLPLPCFMSTLSSVLEKASAELKSKGSGKVYLDKDEKQGIATITLDQVQRKNAISGSMMVQLHEVVTEIENWERGKGIILKSAGDFFCSGGDLTQVSLMNTAEYGLLMSTFMQNTLLRLYSLPMVTATLVQGKAIGGGAELTTATDFRLFSSKAEVTFVQGKMGVATGWGGGTRLVQIVGAKTALNILTTCEKLTPDKALKIGFTDHVFDIDNFETEAMKWFQARTQHDYTVVQAMKKIVVGARDLNVEQSLLNERTVFAPLWGGPANTKALNEKIKHK